MSELLVSVRSVEEAAIALSAGAAIIDVKEPQFGSLGRADDAVIADILNFVAGRRPVSAAMGELLKEPRGADGSPASPIVQTIRPHHELAFMKWGLSGCGGQPAWPTLLARKQAQTSAQVVFVAYADWQCAQAPAIADVLGQACQNPGQTLLLDTFRKDADMLPTGRRPTLLDWVSVPEIVALCEKCRSAKVRIALAGSLGNKDINLLRSARPDWFAVRGAVCEEGQRFGIVQEGRVRALVRLIAD